MVFSPTELPVKCRPLRILPDGFPWTWGMLDRSDLSTLWILPHKADGESLTGYWILARPFPYEDVLCVTRKWDASCRNKVNDGWPRQWASVVTTASRFQWRGSSEIWIFSGKLKWSRSPSILKPGGTWREQNIRAVRAFPLRSVTKWCSDGCLMKLKLWYTGYSSWHFRTV